MKFGVLNPEINIPGVFKEYTMYANVVLLRLNLHVPMKSAFKRVFTDREFTDEKTRKYFFPGNTHLYMVTHWPPILANPRADILPFDKQRFISLRTFVIRLRGILITVLSPVLSIKYPMNSLVSEGSNEDFSKFIIHPNFSRVDISKNLCVKIASLGANNTKSSTYNTSLKPQERK